MNFIAILLVLILAPAPLFAPAPLLAHAKGIYKTQAEAEKRALELGCKGTHQNNGAWMPCGNESHLHQELRKE